MKAIFVRVLLVTLLVAPVLSFLGPAFLPKHSVPQHIHHPSVFSSSNIYHAKLARVTLYADGTRDDIESHVGKWSRTKKIAKIASLAILPSFLPLPSFAGEMYDNRELSDTQSFMGKVVFFGGFGLASYGVKKSCDREDKEEKKRVREEIESFKRKKAEFFNVTAEVESDDDFAAGLRKAAENVTLTDNDDEEDGGEDGDVNKEEDDDDDNAGGGGGGGGLDPIFGTDGPTDGGAVADPTMESGQNNAPPKQEEKLADSNDVERLRRMMGGGGGDGGIGGGEASNVERRNEEGDGRYAQKPTTRRKRVSRFDKPKQADGNKPGAAGGAKNNAGDGGKGGRSDVGATGLLERPDGNQGENTPQKPPDALPSQPPQPKLADAADIERLRKMMGQ